MFRLVAVLLLVLESCVSLTLSTHFWWELSRELLELFQLFAYVHFRLSIQQK